MPSYLDSVGGYLDELVPAMKIPLQFFSWGTIPTDLLGLRTHEAIHSFWARRTLVIFRAVAATGTKPHSLSVC